ncbi:RAP domain [Micractinium conductrix]|uniref:RAP domain n=1 Tax=Micractinium conductrix TaxID=554055 RepID=A0A2P6VLJ4_9CHLO|nr:RAP domain [Micractinium conductrix]|eukprot:PSC74935.1 RAP domain [Micractinium conductrix]
MASQQPRGGGTPHVAACPVVYSSQPRQADGAVAGEKREREEPVSTAPPLPLGSPPPEGSPAPPLPQGPPPSPAAALQGIPAPKRLRVDIRTNAEAANSAQLQSASGQQPVGSPGSARVDSEGLCMRPQYAGGALAPAPASVPGSPLVGPYPVSPLAPSPPPQHLGAGAYGGAAGYNGAGYTASSMPGHVAPTTPLAAAHPADAYAAAHARHGQGFGPLPYLPTAPPPRGQPYPLPLLPGPLPPVSAPPAGHGGGYGNTPRARGDGQARDPALANAFAINRRITAAGTAREIFEIVERDHAQFDTVCLATAMHKLASLRGAPNLHAQIVQSPEFFKLKKLILDRRSEFTARNLANTLWSLAKANHHPGVEFLTAMVGEVRQKIDGGTAQNVANCLWAFATLGFHPGDEVMAALAAAIKQKLPECTSQNISNAILAFAKLEWAPGAAVLEGLAAEALAKIRTFSPQALSNTLWGLSKLGIAAPALMEGIGQEARAQLHEFNSQNLANSVWAYANIGVVPSGELLQDFARAAISRMPEFSPQNISNFLWAFAKLGVQYPELFAEAGRHGARVMHTFTPQSIANMVWSYATIGECPDVPFLQALVGHALRTLPEFSPQNLSNTAWALATLRECDAVRMLHRGLLCSVCSEVTRRLADPATAPEFSRQHLANLVWAVASLEHDPGKKALFAFAEALVQRSDLCNAQEVSNSVWAFARLGFYHAPLMSTMAAEATRRIEEFSQQNLSNLAWAYSKLTHLEEGLLTAVADRVEAMGGELNVQHCTNLIWAYASLGWSTPTLLPTLVKEVKQRMGSCQFNVQQLCNLLWSLAIARCCDRQIWDATLEQLHGLGLPFNQLPDEALMQIFQAWLLLLAEQPEADWPLPEPLLALGQRTWIAATKRITVSEYHAEVSRMLSAMGEAHTIEHLTDDQLFSVDIALPDERVVLEVDGPTHFTANTFQPLADMRGRNALLSARGWRVSSVPFYRWFGETEEGRQAMLRRVLAEARAAPLPQVHPATVALTQRLAALREELEAHQLDWEAAEEARCAALRRQQPAGAAGAAAVAATQQQQQLPAAPPAFGTDSPASGPPALVAAAPPAPLAAQPPQQQPAQAPQAQQPTAEQPEGAAQGPAVDAPAGQEQLLAAKEAAMRLLTGMAMGAAAPPAAAAAPPPSTSVAPPAPTSTPRAAPLPADAPERQRQQQQQHTLVVAPSQLQQQQEETPAVHTPQVPPGLGLVRVAPAGRASAPSTATLAAAEAAARALQGGRAPLFLGQRASGGSPSGAAGSGSAGGTAGGGGGEQQG